MPSGAEGYTQALPYTGSGLGEIVLLGIILVVLAVGIFAGLRARRA